MTLGWMFDMIMCRTWDVHALEGELDCWYDVFNIGDMMRLEGGHEILIIHVGGNILWEPRGR